MFPEQLCLINPIAMNAYAMKRLGELEEWGTIAAPHGPGVVGIVHTVGGT